MGWFTVFASVRRVVYLHVSGHFVENVLLLRREIPSTIADMYSPLYFWMRNDPQLISTLFTICDPMFLIREIVRSPFIVVLGARVVHEDVGR
jgi:hypothetical protein